MISKTIDFIKKKNIFYLIVGFFFTIFSISKFNIVISIFIMAFYCNKMDKLFECKFFNRFIIFILF